MEHATVRTISSTLRRLAVTTTALAAVLVGQSPDPAWSWLSPGEGSGGPKILASPVGGVAEIIVPCSGDSLTQDARYWLVLRRNAAGTDWDEVFASPIRPDGDRIVRLALLPGTFPSIVVMTHAGNVEVWDQATRARNRTFQIGATDLDSGLLADVDRDGNPDVVMAGAGGLHATRLDGTPILAMSGIQGTAITAGQMDGDVSMEIATTDGNVVDVDTQTVEFHWQNRFGVALAALDVDGDGMDELIVAENQSWLWAFDVDLQVPKWSRYVFDLDCLVLANVDADPQIEIVVGGGQFTGILAIDSVTLAQDFLISSRGAGTTGLVVADVDLDGQDELLWVADAFSTAADKLVIVDLATDTVEWSSTEFPIRGVGPAKGDIDGDGIAELVYATGRGAFTRPRIMVVDPATHRLKFSALLTAGSDSVLDFDLVDVDGDGDLEIVIADGAFSVLDFANGQISTLRRSTSLVCRAADIADLDGGGSLEAILAVNSVVVVLDYATSTELWRTPIQTSSISQMVIAQLDADAALEIAVMLFDGNIHVFDSGTHAEQAFVPSGGTAWSTFGVLPANVPGAGLQQPGLVVGDVAGGVTVLVPAGGTYQPLGPFPVTGARIDGLSWVDGSTVFVCGSAGRLQVNDLLTPLWQSNVHGINFGRQTIVDVPNRTLTTLGIYGVSQFQL